MLKHEKEIKLTHEKHGTTITESHPKKIEEGALYRDVVRNSYYRYENGEWIRKISPQDG